MENIVCTLFRDEKGTRLFNSHADIKLPFDYAFVHVKYVYLKTNATIEDNKFEWCSTYKNLPVLVNILFDIVKQYSNNLFQACPYVAKKSVSIKNCPIDLNPILLSILNYKLGDYKTSVKVTDKNGKLIYFINFYETISRKRLQKGSKMG